MVGWLTGRLMVAGLSPINSRNLIIVGRCSPSLQPKRQATWWRLQRSQPRSSLSVTRMKHIESGMWNLKASPDGLAARIGRFGGTDLAVSVGQRRCANPAACPIADRGADLVEVRLLLCSRVARLGCQPLDPVGRPKTCRARARGSRLIDNIFHLRNSA